jgi:hypothetical protein
MLAFLASSHAQSFIPAFSTGLAARDCPGRVSQKKSQRLCDTQRKNLPGTALARTANPPNLLFYRNYIQTAAFVPLGAELA